jgi:hypothetical protein
LYQFQGETQPHAKETTPVMQYSGLYRINRVTSTFKSGQFEQRLLGQRLRLQEKEKESQSSFGTGNLTASAENIMKKISNLPGDLVDTVSDVASSIGKNIVTFITPGD